jgi:acyl-CoA synthetase (AMP-forming)/AMP-acid ligase II
MFGQSRQHARNEGGKFVVWASILDALEAQSDAPGIHLEAGLHGPREHLTPARLLQLAGLAADAFRAAGVGRGDRVVTMLPTGRPLIQAILGTWAAGGAISVVAPSIERGRSSLSLERLRSMLGVISPKLIITTSEDVGAIAELAKSVGARVFSPSDLRAEGSPIKPRSVNHAQDMAFIQFTSGSTGLPKAIVIEHGQLCQHAEVIARRAAFVQSDVCLSWLPLHHDMGFVGLMTPIYFGCTAVQVPADQFVKSPLVWLSMMASYKGTISPAPTFAYQVVSRLALARRLPANLDLSSWRFAWVGAEPVSEQILDRFERTFAACGFRSTMLSPSYGMAETTLAISFKSPDQPRKIVHIDQQEFQKTGTAKIATADTVSTMPLVSNGPPLDGFSVRVVDEDGRDLVDGRQGCILVSGPSVTRRYFGSDENPQPGGWLDTGDLGFVLYGEVYITGRAKDVIIRGGANVHAHEIEQAVLQGMPERTQRAVAFAISHAEDMRDEIVVGVELRSLPPPEDFAAETRRIIARDVGIQIDRVIALPRGAIPRTTSGKIQRGVARDLFRGGDLGRVNKDSTYET